MTTDEVLNSDALELTRDVVFSPIRGSGLVEQTVRRLGEAIEFGLVQSGDRLPSEVEMAARLQVSMVTLREALAVLREASYIETRRGRGGGTYVQTPKQLRPKSASQARPKLSREYIRDLIDVRQIIATGAATLACERAQEADLELLEELLREMDEAKTYKAWRRIDSRFHITIAAAAKSPRLVAAEADIQAEVSAALGDNARHPRILQVINEQHAKIAAAIRRRDVETAVSESQVHVRNTAETLLGMSLA